MATVLLNSSRSPHGNTRRVAEAIGSALDARVLTLAESTPETLIKASLVGFGSGIYWMGFDRALVDRIRDLPDMTGTDAFIFATSGLPEPPFRRYTRQFADVLEDKGFRVVGTFTCRGRDTWGPFKLVGGVSRNRPNAQDLIAAREFAGLLTS